MSELSALVIEKTLTTARIGRPVHWHRSLASTNDVAHDLARGGADDGTLVIADEQTAGKGRVGRRWWAPPGSGLLLSLVLRPPLTAARAQWLTMIAGLACAEAVEATTGLRPGLKWPNDLVLRGRKLGGILTEIETSGEQLSFAVLGIGLNVNVDFRLHAQDQLDQTATGLSQVLGRPVERLLLLNELLKGLEQRYALVREGKSPHADWSERLVTLGRRVKVSTLSASQPCESIDLELIGEAVAVDADGGLILRLPDGRTERVLAGDVTLCDG